MKIWKFEDSQKEEPASEELGFKWSERHVEERGDSGVY